MRISRNVKVLLAWVGLIVYLLLGMNSSEAIVALSSQFAGAHDVQLVQDGNHQDIVFGHAQLKHHSHGYSYGYHHVHTAHSHGHGGASVFAGHYQMHHDHVLHLTEQQKQISSPSFLSITPSFIDYADLLQANTNVLPKQLFFDTASIEALPQPPPDEPMTSPTGERLRTVILLI